MGPLAGLAILDLTSVLMGPYGTQALADMGADVIKVESPEGDIVRQIGPGRTPGMGAMFHNANRDKRSIALDLKKKEGRDTLLRMAKSANALVYNVRPQAMARLGPAPTLGQHGRDILSEAGFSAEEIEQLAEQKAVHLAAPP